jgi:CheY-like chemotaxis protein
MKDEIPAKFQNVMVIDDNRIDLYIASRMITQNNFGKKVMQYSSAIEALKFLRENQENISELPDVIFLDIYMPGMSGFEFMEEYDNLSAPLKNICKVFLISSSLDELDITRANNDENIVDMNDIPITNEFLIGYNM